MPCNPGEFIGPLTFASISCKAGRENVFLDLLIIIGHSHFLLIGSNHLLMIGSNHLLMIGPYHLLKIGPYHILMIGPNLLMIGSDHLLVIGPNYLLMTVPTVFPAFIAPPLISAPPFFMKE